MRRNVISVILICVGLLIIGATFSTWLFVFEAKLRLGVIIGACLIAPLGISLLVAGSLGLIAESSRRAENKAKPLTAGEMNDGVQENGKHAQAEPDGSETTPPSSADQSESFENGHISHMILRQAITPYPSVGLYTIPDPPVDLIGREKELNTLLSYMESFQEKDHSNEGLALLISGQAGVGKTALARQTARSLADSYPDARLEIDLRGDSQPRALPVAEAKRRLLEPFYPGQRLPDDERQLGTLYEDAFRKRRALLLLDNARDMSHVRALLPPTPSAAIVTGRVNLKPAEGGQYGLRLEALTVAEARQLLLRTAPRLEQAREASLSELAVRCGRLPFVLRVTGSMLDQYPDWTVEDLTQKLVKECQRQNVEKESYQPELEIESAVALCYESLEEEDRFHLRSLGVFEAPFEAEAVAAVWDCPVDKALGWLGKLVALGLVEDRGERRGEDGFGGRFSVHHLTCAFAARKLCEHKHEAQVMIRRHADYYLEACRHAEGLCKNGNENRLEGFVCYWNIWPHLDTAWQRFSGEENNWPRPEDSERWLCDFPGQVAYMVYLHQPRRNKIQMLERALSSARILQDRQAESLHMGSLGIAWSDLGNSRKSLEYFEQALAFTRQLGSRKQEGIILGNLGISYADLGDTRQAIKHFEGATTIARETGDLWAEGIRLGNLGDAYMEAGDVERAIRYHEQALTIHRKTGNRPAEGVVLGNLGMAYASQGETLRAIEYYQRALAIDRETGDRSGKGVDLGNLGNAYRQLGDTWRAIEYYTYALGIARQMGDRHWQAINSWNMGLAMEDLGDYSRAADLMKVRVNYERGMGHPDCEKHARRVDEVRKKAGKNPVNGEKRGKPAQRSLRVLGKIDAWINEQPS